MIQMIQIQILSVSDTLAIESYPLDSHSSHTTSVIDMLRWVVHDSVYYIYT